MDLDHHQYLIICSLAHCQPSLKISSKFFGSFCTKLLTDRQSNNDHISSSAEVTNGLALFFIIAYIFYNSLAFNYQYEYHNHNNVLWPIVWDYPGEPVPEETFWHRLTRVVQRKPNRSTVCHMDHDLTNSICTSSICKLIQCIQINLSTSKFTALMPWKCNHLH